jgi:multidrug transporter EmrE-like cation transporter
MKYGIFLSLSILFNVLTNVFFKMASLQSKSKYWLFFATGLFFGLLNSYFITESIRHIKLSVAYTVFYAMSILLLTLISNIYFNETLSTKKLIGIAVVCIGIILLVQEN